MRYFTVPGRLVELLEELLEHASFLEQVEVDFKSSPDDNARPLLLREHPFEALRMLTIRLEPDEEVAGDAAFFESLPHGIEAHSSLLELCFFDIPLQRGHVFSALAAASLHIADITLSSCNLNLSSVPGLVHLVDAGTLSKLFIYNADIAMFDEAGARAFAKAVRDNKTLTQFFFHGVRLWVREMVVSVLSRLSLTWLRMLALQDVLATGQAVVEALVAHPTLNILSLGPNEVADAHRRVVG